MKWGEGYLREEIIVLIWNWVFQIKLLRFRGSRLGSDED